MTDDTLGDLRAKLSDPWWRLTSGKLYWIITKGDDGEDTAVPFIPNEHQVHLLQNLWHRNVITKARQLGMTTAVCIAWLDHALFHSHQRCGIIAHDLESAEVIFRDKVKFAYEHLPASLREVMPLEKETGKELVFAHSGSSIRVATSMRSGTIHRLHVSELGKISAKYADKAKEVMTGSIPAVPQSGILVIESTAEGQEGEFYTVAQRAKEKEDSGAKLTPRDYRLFFYPWWKAQEYRLDSEGVVITEADRAYFDRVEAEIGQPLDAEQRAWYVATREADFPGKPERMWQEYPSTFAEAFQTSTEGVYYASELGSARKQGRVCRVPILDAPVNTFWDLGNGDYTAIWFHQQIGLEHRFLRYYEAAGERLGHFVLYLQQQGFVYGRHYLPHDAEHKRLSDTNQSIREMLEALGVTDIEVVPRITDITVGIQQTRAALSQCWFDEEGCRDGLRRLSQYRKDWDSRLGVFKATPRHDDNSHGADAFRQFGQTLASGGIRLHRGPAKRPKARSWRVT